MKLFKKKVQDNSKTYEGRFITDEEIWEMVKPKKESFIMKEFRELNEQVEKMRHYGE